MDYKYGQIYREVLKVNNVDVCKIVRGLTEEFRSNKLLEFAFQVIDETAPGLIHPCPYNVILVNCLKVDSLQKSFFCPQEIAARNCNVRTQNFPTIFPHGDYRLIFSGTKNGELIGFVNIIGSVISPIKESFGKK